MTDSINVTLPEQPTAPAAEAPKPEDAASKVVKLDSFRKK